MLTEINFIKSKIQQMFLVVDGLFVMVIFGMILIKHQQVLVLLVLLDLKV